ncbi:Cobalt-zinc-cadmium resistance protein CzcC precursor [Crateriforma conspicua]|uniref:Cobalt-zinc-cadmium resistance protein CzcC n=1 Tax=Crateriforma conspicua TaxID=2527996 RepID=A0A5C5Y8E3_9PLAN|nr:Cobalt-zinc-cadmium resistance protein CzcC precursor [Crateriforma conspicua]
MRRFTICSTGLLVLSFSGCASIDQQFGTARVWSTPADAYVATEPLGNIQAATKSDAIAVETVAFFDDEVEDELKLDADDRFDSSENESENEDRAEIAPVRIAEPEVADSDYGMTDFPSMGTEIFTAGPVYTLADIEQIALASNPAIAAASATSGKASGLWNQVGTRPNPTLGYFAQQLADRNTDQHGVFIEQEFVRGDKLKLNQAVLSHTTNAQRWEIETQRQRVLTDVRVRFYEAIAAQQQLDATRQFEEVARRGVEVAVDRQEAEEGTLIDTLQSKTLLSEITLAAERAEVAYHGAWKDLAAIAGLPDTSPARLVAELTTPDYTPDWNVAYSEIVAQSPELSVANALVCEKSALWKRQKVQMVPNITGQLGAGYDNGTDSGMINVQFSAPIPTWNKNQGNISAAYADYTRAVQNVKRIEQAIKSRLARAAQEFDASMATVKKYEQEIIPQATKSLELSEEAYRAGELDFLQVLVVRRSYYESTIRLIEAKGQLAGANAKVDGLVLTGGLDAPQDYTDGDGIRGASFGGQ